MVVLGSSAYFHATAPELFVGIDLGTSGLRLVVVDGSGLTVATASQTWPVAASEQDPAQWLASLEKLWRPLIRELPGRVLAVSATSTSGTVLPTDCQGRPLAAAWLYSDRRGSELGARFGIPAGWGLSRWLWWQLQGSTDCRLTHPSDYLLTVLGAKAGWTDHTCALKSGYDPAAGKWSLALAAGIPAAQLPAVVRPGTVVGTLAAEWGLGGGVKLVAGCTDGVAGQIAGGALAAGQVCLSLGSTLIFKGVSAAKIATADGAVYSHLHPDGRLWLPGAASACGGAILEKFYPREQWKALNSRAATLHLPTGQTAYPLATPGERFPHSGADFAGGLPDISTDDPRFYAGLLEGVAFVERLGLERLIALGMPVQGALLCVGGGTRSEVWLRIRAAVLDRELQLPAQVQPALGAAILAAAGAWGVSVTRAAARMVRLGGQVLPDIALAAAYEPVYRRFLERWAGAD
ncbi:MAG: FGGY-family carbohydrate kinase [Aphanocapsa lilacina HA4352-LM1]|nr:FGGY-family carbohydrate kinase [Aphanocapsa lilacina HA4352-LM1]